ncbi:MAG: DUF3786 domain-containing protein [Desulfobacterales bacterium]|nr:DUF3786 domain-containing protein [Desulfobacterales bacterium]
MAAKGAVFEKIYRDYLDQVAALDLSGKDEVLGIRRTTDGIWIPLFNRAFCITEGGILDPQGRQPVHAVCVALCRYLILCPETVPMNGTQWVSYRNFKDAAPFAGAFAKNAEAAIAKNFTGQTEMLESACGKLGGSRIEAGLSYDLTMRVYGLPRVPLFLLFNDGDEEFAAECSVLFERRAERFLDMECLAILGWLLSDYLAQAAGWDYETLM